MESKKRKKRSPYINTERTHRINEEQLYFSCPICGVNISVPEDYRNDDHLRCRHCKKKFKNPLIYPNDKTEYKKIRTRTNESDYWSDYNKKHPGFKYVMIVVFIFLFIYFVGKLSEPDPEYDEFINTRAKMMMLKEKGLATDKDIKQYEDSYYESKRKK